MVQWSHPIPIATFDSCREAFLGWGGMGWDGVGWGGVGWADPI